MILVQCRQRVELLELGTSIAKTTVNGGQCLTCTQEAWREFHRCKERVAGFVQVLLFSETESQQIVRFCKLSVERDCLTQERNRMRHASGAFADERELVKHPGILVIELYVVLVVCHCSIVLIELIRHVTKALVGSRRSRVELGSSREVSKGRRKVTAALIRLTAFQVRHHRIRLEGKSAAVGFDRDGRPALERRRVAVGDEPLERSVTTETGVDEHSCHYNQQYEQDKDGPTHLAQW